ncbi:MAG: minor capsid protein [Patescibacteria group bacterium]|nr:minor capsid protein [Patescibacteria group bacterium]
MRYLKPFILKRSDYEDVENQLQVIFRSEISHPLVAAFLLLYPYPVEQDGFVLHNVLNASDEHMSMRKARNIISEGIRIGKFHYKDGEFTGDFDSESSAAMRLLGGEKQGKEARWRLEPAGPIAEAIAWRGELAEAITQSLLMTLRQIERANEISRYEIDASGSIEAANESLQKSLEAVAVKKQMSAEQEKFLRETYTENMNLYIKNFTKERVVALREKIEELYAKGDRIEAIADILADEMGIERRRADFLASNESRLMAVHYRQSSVAELGLTRYRWDARMDAKTRPDHAALNGKILKYSEPPIADTERGLRANAGILWNCRCVDMTIIE